MILQGSSVARVSADGHPHEQERIRVIRKLFIYSRQFAVLPALIELSGKSPIALMQRKYIVGIAITKNIRYPIICLCRFAIFILCKNTRGWLLGKLSKGARSRVSIITRFLRRRFSKRRNTDRLPAVYLTRRVGLTAYIFRELSRSSDADKIPHTRLAIPTYDYPQKSFQSRSGILRLVSTHWDLPVMSS